MKPILRYSSILITALLILSPKVYAQEDTIQTKERIKNIVTVEEGIHQTRVSFPGGNVEVSSFNDTVTKISIGRRRYEIIEKPGSHTRIQVVRKPLNEFKGHWSGFDLGLTNFFSTPFDSNLPDEDAWMDLNGGKSVVVGMNLLQYNIGLQQHRHNFGIVTGAGWTINNYRLDSPNIIRRGEDGQTTYQETDRTVEKNKLVTSFLTVPLLLELQLPSHTDGNDFFISAGFYGSFRLGSHTKVVFNDNGREKEKWREDLNLNAFKYGAMVRTGYRWIRLYAKCDLTPMFEAGRGPELYPWSVGLTLLQF